MRKSWQVLAVVIGITTLATCADYADGPPEPLAPARQAIMGVNPPGQQDPALEMRAGLREMPEAEYLEMVERSGNLVIVGFKEPGTMRGVSRVGLSLVPDAIKDERIHAVATQLADTIIYRFKHIPAVAVRLPAPQTALALRQFPWVDYVTPSSGLVTPDMQGSCAPISSPETVPWHIQRIGAPDAWTIATGNAPEALVLLDDGADEGGGWYSQELFWEVYSYYVPSTVHDGEHGTLVLGTAQADDNTVGTVGVAPTAVARVMKIYDPDPQYNEWEMYAAIAVDENATRASVMTISYSTKITSPDPPPSFTNLYDAITNAYYQHGVLFTASTGNQSNPNYYAYPARFDEVIGVGGSGHSDEYVLNNYAPGNVDIAAPAVDVLTVCKGGDIGTVSGTSFSTPMVAGAIMLLREDFPNISNDSLTNRLLNTADPMASTLRSGAGRLDVAEAIGYVPPPEPPEPRPIEVRINGPTQVQPGMTCTWIAQVSGGEGPFSYEWYIDNNFADTGKYITRSFSPPEDVYQIYLYVWDYGGRSSDDDMIVVYLSESAPGCLQA